MEKVYIIEKQYVETSIVTDSRDELIEKFTRWVDEFRYKHHIHMVVHAFISDVPYEVVPDGDGQYIPAPAGRSECGGQSMEPVKNNGLWTGK
jgi:hypothetical protein